MTVRVTKGKYNDFKNHLEQYEKLNGVQDVNGIRVLARAFAATYSADHKAVQPLYCCFFTTICYKRNIQLPDDYNDDNYWDPDGLYPDDKEIKKKLRRFELEVQKQVEAIIHRSDTDST
jgi:hypothetical protein